MGRTVLIVDDEKSIVEILAYNLKQAEYETLAAYDGKEALDLVRKSTPDLVLLDVMLPYIDGFEVCKTLRAEGNMTPIIMITAREDETDKVFGLEIGADDYITKPFSMRELLARVNANMRRAASAEEPQQESGEIIRRGSLSIDAERYMVSRDGAALDLTQREFDLLKFLALSPGKVITRAELMREVWQYDYYGDLRAVDVAVRRLREKLEKNPAEPEYIITKRGIGYYFNEK